VIQFSRASSIRADSDINKMIGAMTTGISTRPYLVTETLLELGAKYPDNLRVAAIAARMARWAAVEWEDIGMDREFGAREACARVKAVDFPPSNVRFDAAFERE
jgi:hypothetical protein